MNELLTLKNIEYLKIVDSDLIGCDQDWYGKPWQRLSGCGPTCASMMALYQVNPSKAPKTMDEAKTTMNAVWHYITPSFGGINRLDRFYNGFSNYLNTLNLPHTNHALEIPKQIALRPQLTEILDFIMTGLKQDSPIAFLNLNNGKVHNLEAYHWVLIIGLEQSSPDEALVHIVDSGKHMIIDLSLWLKTTTSSGGFVYVTF